MTGPANDALAMQALISGYVAASVAFGMPLTPPVKLLECEPAQPIKIRLASGLIVTITVVVDPPKAS